MAKSIGSNATTALQLHDVLVGKCMLGEKQEEASKDAQKKIAALCKKMLSAAQTAPTTLSVTHEKVWDLEKQNLLPQIVNTKDKAKAQEKLATDHKKEADDAKKELSQAQKRSHKGQTCVKFCGLPIGQTHSGKQGTC